MIKKILLNTSKIGNLVLTWFNFCMFFAMRPCWSGISKTLGYENDYSSFIYNLPVIIWILLFCIALSNTILFVISKKERKLYSFIYNGVNIVFLVAIIVIIKMGALDYMDYIWPNFFKYVGLAAVILGVIFFIFIYPKGELRNSKIFKWSVFGVTISLILVNLVNFTFNFIKTGAVVYAVENEYQIVFSSNTEARAWVEVNNVRYFDNYNGSNRSNTKVHKVTVPMEVLDQAKEYEIHVQKITYRGPFGGYFGRDISEKYTFNPVDSSDGISYFSLSDIHMAGKASSKVSSYINDKELLVLAGDIVSMMDTFEDANLVNVYAHNITKGKYPVVYARGNHEIKGKYAELFHNFVGTKGDRFYYNFYLDGIYGVVLDIGEDHDDDYWEYYDTAYYEQYREEQIEFLKQEVVNGKFKDYDYRLAVCHIPVAFINSRKNHKDQKERLTEVLNDLYIDMMISGHQHDLYVFEPDTVTPNSDGKLVYNPNFTSKKTYSGMVTDHKFVNILVSKRGYTQTDNVPLIEMKSQIGLHTFVDLSNKTQTCSYYNSKGEKVKILNPFAEIDYGDTFSFPLRQLP